MPLVFAMTEKTALLSNSKFKLTLMKVIALLQKNSGHTNIEYCLLQNLLTQNSKMLYVFTFLAK